MSCLLPLVIFTRAGQLYAIESCTVRGRGRMQSQPKDLRMVDFALLLGQSADQPDQWLRLQGIEQDWLLGLTGEMDLIELPAEAIHPLPALLAARLEFKPLRALAWYQQQLVMLLDARLLGQLAEKPA